jgi:16S rRNA (guanine1207-N2)-methyltransferase
MHCGTGLTGAVAARLATGGQVTLLDANCVAVEAARRTLAANLVTNATVTLSDCAQAVLDRAFDTVISLLPKSRAAWEQTILDAAIVLRDGGDFFLAGANKAGIKSAARFIERTFGEVHVLAYRGGCRVVRASKGEATVLPGSDYYAWQNVTAHVDEEVLQFVTKPGLFSWQHLDAGTRLLIQALRAHPLNRNDRVLDIGCGTGVLTLYAARQAPDGQVTAVDVDCRAVEATRRTLTLNQITNAEVKLSDCGDAVQNQTFSAVVTNPPFHREQATTYVIADQIIRDAARLLETGGRLYLVANSFLKYRPMIETTFGNATILRETTKFKVWQAIKMQ